MDVQDDLSPEEDALNAAAYLALQGDHADVQGAIVQLLMSDARIAPAVRRRLAEAVQKTSAETGIRLEVRGEGSGKKDNKVYQLSVRRRWIEAGQHMQDLIDGGITLDEARRHVGQFGLGASQAANAWKYYQEARKWASANPALQEQFSRIHVDADAVSQAMFSLYHMRSLNGAV